jgi:DNA-binding YbaB/EbfC family protein
MLRAHTETDMDLNSLMQVFGPMQEKLKSAETERASQRVEGSAGGGAVRVSLRGDLELERVTVAPAAAAAVGDDPSMLEDLIQAAMNDALRQYKQRYGATAEEQMQKLLGGSDMGGMLGSLLGGLGKPPG